MWLQNPFYFTFLCFHPKTSENMIFCVPASKTTCSFVREGERDVSKQTLWPHCSAAMLYQANSCCLSAKACWLPELGLHSGSCTRPFIFGLMISNKNSTSSNMSYFISRRNKNICSCLTSNFQCLDKLVFAVLHSCSPTSGVEDWSNDSQVKCAHCVRCTTQIPWIAAKEM